MIWLNYSKFYIVYYWGVPFPYQSSLKLPALSVVVDVFSIACNSLTQLIKTEFTSMSVFRSGLFAGKTAIVTGGATGIGYAITKELLYLGKFQHYADTWKWNNFNY